MVQRIRGRGAHRATVGLVVGKRGLHIISCRTENTICSTGNMFINRVGENMESNALIARGVLKSNNCPGHVLYVRAEQDKYTFRMCGTSQVLFYDTNTC
jgi:hypothetical protein